MSATTIEINTNMWGDIGAIGSKVHAHSYIGIGRTAGLHNVKEKQDQYDRQGFSNFHNTRVYSFIPNLNGEGCPVGVLNDGNGSIADVFPGLKHKHSSHGSGF